MDKKETIIALATAPLPAGVAVIRLSGPHAWQTATSLCPTFATKTPRVAHYGAIYFNNELIDHALLVGFKAPQSFTGEDVVEIHCHGGPAVIQAVLEACLVQPHTRQAQAGEFSRRAFMNHKMDLTQAEGLADLIAAETEEQRKQALRQLEGTLGEAFETLRLDIMSLLAQVEAGIDFPDEELDILADENIFKKLSKIISFMERCLAENTGQRLRDGFRIAVLGRPNAGKSTLANLLSGKETAIVSPVAGTTRDVVEAHLNIGGFPIILADTAGLRHGTDAIEREGIKRAAQQAEQADIILAVIDSYDWPSLAPQVTKHLRPDASLLIISKTDEKKVALPPRQDIAENSYPVLGLNLTDPASLSPLLETLTGMIQHRFATARQAALLTRQRHREAIDQALATLQRAHNLIQNPPAHTTVAELLAQDLRDAASSIGNITGRTTSEDILDIVFSTFCIGK
jgi:tRNA modification GTPase